MIDNKPLCCPIHYMFAAYVTDIYYRNISKKIKTFKFRFFVSLHKRTQQVLLVPETFSIQIFTYCTRNIKGFCHIFICMYTLHVQSSQQDMCITFQETIYSCCFHSCPSPMLIPCIAMSSCCVLLTWVFVHKCF